MIPIGRTSVCGSLLRRQHHADPKHTSGVVHRRCDRDGAGFGWYVGLLAKRTGVRSLDAGTRDDGSGADARVRSCQ
jgi:hypothetical protein